MISPSARQHPSHATSTDRAGCSRTVYQLVLKAQLHSTGAVSRLPPLLLGQILPVFSLVAPCQPGASPVSVRRWTFTTDCWVIRPGRG